MTSEEHTALIQLIFIIFVAAVIGVIIWAVVTMHKTELPKPIYRYATEIGTNVQAYDPEILNALCQWRNHHTTLQCDFEGHKYVMEVKKK